MTEDAKKKYEKLAEAVLELYITIKLRPQDEVRDPFYLLTELA